MRTRTSKPFASWLIRQPSVSGRERAGRNGIRLMSNCISLCPAIFRAFTVLTSFYEITARTQFCAGRVRHCGRCAVINARIRDRGGFVRELLPRHARRELNFALGSFCDTLPYSHPAVTKRESPRKFLYRVQYPKNRIMQKLYKVSGNFRRLDSTLKSVRAL